MNKRILSYFYFLFFCLTSYSQVTTSSISGLIFNEEKEPLPGAIIKAIHEPSGTIYSTVSNTKGKYYIQDARPGGPYKIDISYIGYQRAVFTKIYLSLSETYSCNAILQSSAILDEIIVTGTASKFAGEKTGASTRITSEDIRLLPNINRSLGSIVQLSPYANRSGTIGGRDQRMNNYNIDGANFNYNMGLDGASLPGGGNPISIDAIEEVQVGIAPYDVRQTNFIGAVVNVATKSGTNMFRGSAYSYIKNENLRGNTIDGESLGKRPEERLNIYGFTLGGPIIKNKLFFFVNAEYENRPYLIHKWKLSTDGKEDQDNMISRVTASDMQRFSRDLKEMYGYDTGSWTDFNGGLNTYRAIARIDWNISEKHKMMLRYNYTSQQQDNNLVGNALGINGGPVSIYSMTFRNSTWKQFNNVSSLTAELNSRIGASMNNKLLVSYTFNDGNKRECNGDFPTVDIMKPDASGINRSFMNAGYEQHAWRNGIQEKVWSITDNIALQFGNHYVTAGVSFESQNVSNTYMRYGAGYYRYASYEDFINKAAPVAFALTYSLTGKEKALADVHYNQYSVYAQDEYNPNMQLKLIYGVRMEIPSYVNKKYANPSITNYDFNGTKLSTAHWPKATPLFSPRVGFNYDLLGNKALKIRGGTGIFTGRFPLIFLSKMQEGSGMLQTTVSTTQANDPLLAALAGGIRNPQQLLSDIAQQFPDKFPTKPGAVNSIITIDRNFKTPQVWKNSLAVDYILPLPFKADLTLEGTFIKDINAIVQRNLNVIPFNDPSMSRFNGPDNRYYYPGNVEKRIHKEITHAMVMTNTHKGYSYNLNATLHMTPVNGLNIMAAYTYTKSRTMSSNASNQIEGAWQQEPTVQGANHLSLRNARYVYSPHNVIARINYSFNYGNNFSTGISLLYNGSRTGTYSYIYDGDMNNDGYQYDLMYVPANPNEINLQELKVGNRVFSIEEQRKALWSYIKQDPYLEKHLGEYTEGFGAFLPWLNIFDLRLTQDFKINVGKTTNTLQLCFDIANLGNLLNSSWGVPQKAVTSQLLTYKGKNQNGEPIYTMKTINEKGNAILPYKSFTSNRNSSNCWQLQLGIRYIFN